MTDVAINSQDKANLRRDWPYLLHDTPTDCLFDSDGWDDNPRPQRVNGLDKRDYDHWRTLKAKALYSATREERDRIRAKIDAEIERIRRETE